MQTKFSWISKLKKDQSAISTIMTFFLGGGNRIFKFYKLIFTPCRGATGLINYHKKSDEIRISLSMGAISLSYPPTAFTDKTPKQSIIDRQKETWNDIKEKQRKKHISKQVDDRLPLSRDVNSATRRSSAALSNPQMRVDSLPPTSSTADTPRRRCKCERICRSRTHTQPQSRVQLFHCPWT